MAGVVEAAQRKLQAARDALANAEASAEKARQERDERNRARLEAFWSDAAGRCSAAIDAAREAEGQVVAHAAAGDAVAALEAYPEYVRRAHEAEAVVNLAKEATRVYVFMKSVESERLTRPSGAQRAYPTNKVVEVREPAAWHEVPPPGQYRTEYGPGVPNSAGFHAVTTFPELLTRGMEQLVDQTRATFGAEYLADLTAVLETDD